MPRKAPWERMKARKLPLSYCFPSRVRMLINPEYLIPIWNNNFKEAENIKQFGSADEPDAGGASFFFL